MRGAGGVEPVGKTGIRAGTQGGEKHHPKVFMISVRVFKYTIKLRLSHCALWFCFWFFAKFPFMCGFVCVDT